MSAANDFYQKQAKKHNWPIDDLCPPPMTDAEAVSVLTEGLLGKNWYSSISMSASQVTTQAVYEILLKYIDTPKRKRVSLIYATVLAFFLGLIIGVILP